MSVTSTVCPVLMVTVFVVDPDRKSMRGSFVLVMLLPLIATRNVRKSPAVLSASMNSRPQTCSVKLFAVSW